MSELKQQHEEMLEQRRQKLVALLTEEEKQYEQEFFANQETPEQVREKMAKRLQELRTKREQKRKDEVQKRLDIRFEKSADELRKLDSQFQAVNTKLDQEQQMLEKVRRREEEMQGSFLGRHIDRGAAICEAVGGGSSAEGETRGGGEGDQEGSGG